MNFLFQVRTAIFFGLIAFLLFLYRNFRNKKLAPPEAGGAWPIIGHLHLLGGPEPAHKVLGKMADKYGPIFTVKLGVHRALIASNWEMAKECLTINDRVFANRPKTLALESENQWCNHRLHDHNANSNQIDMKRWFNDVTLNEILRLVLGKRSDDDQNGQWKGALVKFLELSGLFVVSDGLPFLRWFDIGGHEKEMKKSKELDVVAQQWVNEHKLQRTSEIVKVNGEDQDVMDVLLSVIDDSEKEFEGRDADTIIKATCLPDRIPQPVTLVWVLSLLKNPHTLKKVQQELDTHIGRDKQVKESDIDKLIYLQAAVKETLLLYPPGPLLIPHESTEDCIVANYHVPENTQLHVNFFGRFIEIPEFGQTLKNFNQKHVYQVVVIWTLRDKTSNSCHLVVEEGCALESHLLYKFYILHWLSCYMDLILPLIK
ncbi:demethylepipodophyllotoxin synthase-like [Rutidosis leptorrhynchoides]|uniref:demethylepipodophyllotoxin synthase-like n=1 Tax=Rutidosis leptorrhynchoides TaxID=125765 RepID=UPI003A98DC3C